MEHSCCNCEFEHEYNSQDDAVPEIYMHRPRRTLLFPVAVIMDVNECALDFLEFKKAEKGSYYKILEAAVVREAV